MATCQLYQLYSLRKMEYNDYFKIDGPWDTHGRVINSKPKNGKFLNLVRGVQNKDSLLPVKINKD